jgi:murein DD-endopeptidase MepM/ murein hydrolase activator NlpD
MRRVVAGALFLLAGCSNPSPTARTALPSAQPTATVTKLEQPPAPEPATIEPPKLEAPSPKLDCSGPATQGGAIVCRTAPDAVVLLDGKKTARADADGVSVLGLPRTQGSPAEVSLEVEGAAKLREVAIDVIPRHDTVTKFEMECSKIAPQSEADKKKADLSWAKKEKALKKFNQPLAPIAFEGPVTLEGVVYSSSFGATRTYVPKTKDCEPSTSVHNGTDIAVGKGTEIHAPMAGTVILADPDLFYEGGCIFLDLGRGLVSVTMHMSRIDVKAGQVVKQGDLLGLSGATGRVTGPHLHWAIKYRNVFSNDRGTDIWLDPMLVMKLKSPN